MALRKIVRIDEDRCNGCGECVPACAEGAIQIVDGKARLVADNLCDGLGACLKDCPMDAITIEERDADTFDEEAVKTRLDTDPSVEPIMDIFHHGGGGCPGSRTMQFDNVTPAGDSAHIGSLQSELRQWPVQLHLVAPTAPYFKNADVLLAADCVAFTMKFFHQTHLKNKSLAIACPKLDDGMDAYLKKLISMIDDAQINTLTVMIMEVPCCGGLLQLAQQAIATASRKIPLKLIRISLRGEVL